MKYLRRSHRNPSRALTPDQGFCTAAKKCVDAAQISVRLQTPETKIWKKQAGGHRWRLLAVCRFWREATETKLITSYLRTHTRFWKIQDKRTPTVEFPVVLATWTAAHSLKISGIFGEKKPTASEICQMTIKSNKCRQNKTIRKIFPKRSGRKS